MPAGRPRAFDTDKALDAAIGVFWKHGYEGASLETLTGAMGINRPSLYAAFGDKADLFEKAVIRYGDTHWAQIRDALDRAGDVESAIDAYFDTALRLVASRGSPRGCLVACVLSEASEADPRWRALAAARTEAGRAETAASLARFVPPVHAARLALLIGTLAAGIAVLARTGAGAAVLAEARSLAGTAAKAAAVA